MKQLKNCGNVVAVNRLIILKDECSIFRRVIMYITLATGVTLFRLVLSPIFMYAILTGGSVFIVLPLGILIACSDYLDGYIARKYNQESTLGQLLDPIADKAFIMMSAYALSYGFADPIVRYGIYFLIAKEFTLLMCAAVLYLNYKIFIKPMFFSRLVSVSEMILILILVINRYVQYDIPMVQLQAVIMILCSLAGALLLYYAWYVMQLLRKKV